MLAMWMRPGRLDMDIDSYAEWAQGALPAGTRDDLAVLALSLVGDAAEVGEAVKRSLRGEPLDRGRLAHELGDVLFYWACLCRQAGVKPSVVLEQSRRVIGERLAKRAGAKP
jgi:NTP pyrophosphatase (non-canonical NTP hydrolase)